MRWFVMDRIRSQLTNIVAVLILCACSSVDVASRIGAAGNGREIFVVHDSWHAALVVKTDDLSVDRLPEAGDFPTAEYLEFSWGDADYFPAPQGGLRLALRAAFFSRGSVLHVVGLDRGPRQFFPEAEIIRIPLGLEAFQRLEGFLSGEFERAGPDGRGSGRPGLVANARFYPSTGKFSILRTCNTWVAEALKHAGLPISSGFVITAASLGNRVRPLGFVVD